MRNALVPGRRRFPVAVAGLTAALLMLLPAAPAGAHGGGPEDVPVAGLSVFLVGLVISVVAGAMVLAGAALMLVSLSRRKRAVPAKAAGLMAAGSAPQPPIGPQPVAHAAPAAPAPVAIPEPAQVLSEPAPTPVPAPLTATAVAEARPEVAKAPAKRSCANCGNVQQFPGRFCIACGTRFE